MRTSVRVTQRRTAFARVDGETGHLTADEGTAVHDDFESFARREHPRLVGALTYLTGDHGTAEQLAQDALVRAHDRWSRVRRLDRPGAWVHRVAVNLGRSWLRRRSAERRALARVGVEHTVHEDRPAEDLAVRDAVAALPRRQREVIVLRFFLGHDVASTADVLGIATGTVTSTTSDALGALRGALDDQTLAMTPQEVAR